MTRAERHNDNKVDLSLMPRIANYEECKVWQDGIQEYSRNNWRKLWGEKTYSEVMASLLRHALAITEGELFDKKSGRPHAAHIRCNAAMILEYMEKKGLLGDLHAYQPAPGKKVDTTNLDAVAEGIRKKLFTNGPLYNNGEWGPETEGVETWGTYVDE